MAETESAFHIRTDGTTTLVTPAKGPRFSLEELQGMVGGYIERVFAATGDTIWINEDGISLDLPVNATATTLVRPDFLILAPGLRGDVVLMKTQLPDEEDTP